ncbi:MAG: acylphosphatase [Methylobacteriaceae bacterium]|nr:acylphosphatase [Methylobacteriaceae bacterium]
MRAVRIFVSGRVQGVGFRYFVAGEARALGLAGFVRNLRDGRVEAEVSGSAARIEALIAACRRGPPGSRVDRVEIVESEAATLPDPFEIRRDG